MALTRSQQMSRIRGKDTTPERVLRSALWAAGFRYRVHHETPVGRPDVVFPTEKVAVFIDGCFWHGCPLHYVRPRSREEFWSAKLTENLRRDRQQTMELEELGWRVLRIWEHEVFEQPAAIVELVRAALTSEFWQPDLGWRVTRVIEEDPENKIETRVMVTLRGGVLRQETGRRITAKWKRPD
jgi:DNA mismatch endonuclease (patch repair protein)